LGVGPIVAAIVIAWTAGVLLLAEPGRRVFSVTGWAATALLAVGAGLLATTHSVYYNREKGIDKNLQMVLHTCVPARAILDRIGK